jgi:hypothetical protein
MRAYSLQIEHRLCCIAHLIRRFIPPLQFPFMEVAGPPPEISIPVAPSALSFFSVASRWCSMTLRFLKYVTCPRNQHEFTVVQHSPLHSNPAREAIPSFSSIIHSQPYVPSYLRMRSQTPSTPAHRHSQHCARAVRSGAMKPPSCEGAGGGGVGCAEAPPNQPMVDVLKECEGVVC